MTLKELLLPFQSGAAQTASGGPVDASLWTRDVSGIVFDSRRLKEDSVFVAVRGGRVDGHDFLKEAVREGAIALVVESTTKVPQGFSGVVLTVQSTRKALSFLAARYKGVPSLRLKTIGVTGTNGKTTVTHMVEAILNQQGWPTGVIGTIDHHLGEKVWKSEMTTPDPLTFQTRLQEFIDAGAQAVALEVSSTRCLVSNF